MLLLSGFRTHCSNFLSFCPTILQYVQISGEKSPKGLHDEISYRNLKKVNLDDFIHDLENAPWSLLEVFDDVNEKLATWELIYNDVLNCHMPICQEKSKTQMPVTLDEQRDHASYTPERPVQIMCEDKYSRHVNVQEFTQPGGKKDREC